MSVSVGPLAVTVGGRTLTFPPDREIVIGRDPGCAVVLADPRVSRRHAVLTATSDCWWWQDCSTAGSWTAGGRIQRARIDAPLLVRLADPVDGPTVALALTWPSRPKEPAPAWPAPEGSAPDLGSFVVSQPVGRRLRIGRAADNDVVIGEDLTVSRHHAEIQESPAGVELIDLRSATGTFLGGTRIQRARLLDGALIGIGRRIFVYRGGRLEQYLDDAAGITARGLTVTVDGGRRLLDDVSFAVEPGQVLAVLGTTGAGKSTLLRALTGFAPATEGRVHYSGRDLYGAIDELRRRIGYVPQDDILHTALSLRRALSYSAALRFAGDTRAAERAGRVEEVLGELGLTQRAGLPISALSGGQRKRASVAVELLTRPSLLFLDEPTSGLDPGFERSVMQLLRDLADGGRTVVVITHSVASLDLCDRVLFLAPGGRMAYFGPPAEILGYFGAATHAEIFQRLEAEAARDWPGALRGGPGWERYVAEPLRRMQPALAPPPTAAREAARPAGRGRQLWTLARRNVAVLAGSRGYAALILAQAPLIALLLLATLQTGNLVPGGSHPRILLLVLIVSAISMGLVNACREIVKELAIYRRERTVGLSLGAYLGSKFLCLGALAAVQSVVLVALVVGPQGDPEHLLTLAPVVLLVALAATALGLAISALVSTEAAALVLIPVVLVAQLVLSNAVFSTETRPGLGQAAWATPTYWGFRSAAATVDLRSLDEACFIAEVLDVTGLERLRDGSPSSCSESWRPDAAHRLGPLLPLAGLTLAFGAVAAVALRRRDPVRR